ncbi:hypothetical protein MOST_01220 [Moorella stamsii]|uniref:Uncharacterized protein n=1 Tax=Neomoorella stamsii TaxID=1266720 RepID=A0A9X7J5J7_9FIRM|nr:hypothetical protein MOST_01220 [Moorella stamsii]
MNNLITLGTNHAIKSVPMPITVSNVLDLSPLFITLNQMSLPSRVVAAFKKESAELKIAAHNAPKIIPATHLGNNWTV